MDVKKLMEVTESIFMTKGHYSMVDIDLFATTCEVPTAKIVCKGRNNKKSFESYELSTIVVESVHFFFGKLNGNEAIIKNAIKDWLKAAQTRLKSNTYLDAVSSERLHVETDPPAESDANSSDSN
ncbi:unnamed protein product [Allacma fusca]|uniref:Uncharacterized protein n=1 Tax=Allacma fusca TaxID=39272 RepID=A0A8J2KVF5_9HEXA|nr:unnamed protein product [Allacma fusca]